MGTRLGKVLRQAIHTAGRWYTRHPQRVFSHIHATNAWGSAESVSGFGSTLEQTAALRDALPTLLTSLHVSTMLDIPCGDWNWMNQTPLPDIRVTGADVVPGLIEANRAKHGHMATFAVLDAVNSELPRVDLIMTRDLLVHLPFRDIAAVLENFRRSGSEYLLTTSFTNATRENHEVDNGDWRPLNLEKPPFSFPSPLEVIDERCTESAGAYSDKSLLLWRLADLPPLGHLTARGPRARRAATDEPKEVWRLR